MSRRDRAPKSTNVPRVAAPPGRRLLTILALAVGSVLWIVAGNDMPPARWAVVLVVVGISLVPPVTRILISLLDRLRNPSRRTAEWTGFAVGVVATVYLVATAFIQERPLAPRMFDESSYAIGAQILARGRLWMPPHPLADFFDAFFLTARPVYSSIYFPGTALAFAPGVWLSWPTWLVPVLLSGVSVALLFRIVTALTADGAAGLLGALWVVSLMAFRALSVMTMSHVVLLFLGLLLMWAWMRWRDGQLRRPWALAIGAFAGWAAITRPVDALAYALPVGVAMLISLRWRNTRTWATTFGLLVLGAAPFLALQIAHNVGVTGRPLRTAYTDYLMREQPGAQFGVRRFDPTLKPASNSPQVTGYYAWVRGYLEHHQPGNFLRPWFAATTLTGGRVQPANFLTLADNALPARALLPMLFAGVVALLDSTDRRRWVLAATLPLFVVLYVFNPFFLPHYVVVAAPAMILISLLGIDGLSRAVGNARLSSAVRVAGVALFFATSLTSLWEVKWLLSSTGCPPRDGFQEVAPQSMVERGIAQVVKPPAVVLFGQPPDLWTEMAYNTDVAWPDDAPIIRAHDLGERDVELIDYYGQLQPERTIYQFDWRRGSLKTLGKAGELRERLLRASQPQKR
jgi:hypothetical protein